MNCFGFCCDQLITASLLTIIYSISTSELSNFSFTISECFYVFLLKLKDIIKSWSRATEGLLPGFQGFTFVSNSVWRGLVLNVTEPCTDGALRVMLTKHNFMIVF